MEWMKTEFLSMSLFEYLCQYTLPLSFTFLMLSRLLYILCANVLTKWKIKWKPRTHADLEKEQWSSQSFETKHYWGCGANQCIPLHWRWETKEKDKIRLCEKNIFSRMYREGHLSREKFCQSAKDHWVSHSVLAVRGMPGMGHRPCHRITYTDS